MLSAFFISQILVGMAFVSDLASFQFKDRKVTLTLFTLSASLIAAHYFLLDQITAGIVISISATRFFVSIFSTDRRLKYLFLILVTVAGVWTYSQLIDLIMIAIAYLATLAAFDSNVKRLRQIMMLVTLGAITFNIIIFTPVGIFVEAFFLGSNLLSYWRFYLKKQPVDPTVASSA